MLSSTSKCARPHHPAQSDTGASVHYGRKEGDQPAHTASALSFEGVSGATANRPALRKALAALRPGDVLVTWKLDRLGRSLADLIDIVERLEGQNVGFRSLSEAIDTTTAGGRLIFHVMGALAEFERALISERTRAGMAAAKLRGHRMGRPPKLTAAQIEEARTALEERAPRVADVAARLGVSVSTVARAVRRER